MAIIKCKECGDKVSTKAKICPACGTPIKKSSGCSLVLLLFLGVLLAGGAGLAHLWKEAAENASNAPVKTEPAQTVDGYLASPSKEALQRAIRYATQNDEAAVAQMIQSGQVIWLQGGMTVEFVDSGGFSSGLVRIRPRGSTLELWTVSEAIR